MERILLDRKRKAVLPVNVNGRDFDLEFDAHDLVVKATVIGMAKDLFAYGLKTEKMSERIGELEKKKGPDGMKELFDFLHAVAQEGLELCADMSGRMASIVPDWKSVAGSCNDYNVYKEIVAAMEKIIADTESGEKVAEQIEEER